MEADEIQRRYRDSNVEDFLAQEAESSCMLHSLEIQKVAEALSNEASVTPQAPTGSSSGGSSSGRASGSGGGGGGGAIDLWALLGLGLALYVRVRPATR